MSRLFRCVGALVCTALLGACGIPDQRPVGEGKVSVVASTPILADVVHNVAGDAADVRALMARGVDPHSYEPSLHATRDIAYADAVFTNGLLLEPQSLTNTIAATARETTPVVPLAQEAQRYGFAPIPLVEDASLDAVWLGLRVDTGQQLPATGVADLQLVDVDGPGDAFAFILGTFGTPEVVFNSRDGLDNHDAKTLPVDAHTHLSWAFSHPGVYKLTLAAQIRDAVGAPERANTQSTVTVVVGQDPARVAPGMHAVEKGHVDITAELDEQGTAHLVLNSDDDGHLDPAHVAVTVPNTTLQPIPPERAFRFLGTPGEETYLLPQAVLGNHVHGELDPHVWHDVRAMKAIVQVIRDELAAVDPRHAETYQANAHDYLQQLDAADDTMREAVAAVPEEQRNLVTTHHGYSYLARAYGLRVAGFVTPNPSVEPSPRDVIAFTRTLENLHVPAVFLEPQLAGRSTVLTETAAQLGIEVCPIWGDTLDPPGSGPADTYIHLVEANAASIRRCLGRNEK
ncbi:anchored repeat ABC transporter, substrate-binding protein [Corynebacterium sp. NML140438]|uniref:anchored repeat ABC transporter, substrate-binding protein n=1 Tax=Corynebacterium sp. NML140438 TaxID=1906334 RepID=UPI00116058C0|nr:anchored repeat ABC transporter, substrate-binding protein [Corynebacterium sp. NML140438]